MEIFLHRYLLYFHRIQPVTKPFSGKQCKALHSTHLPRRSSTEQLYMTHLFRLDEMAKQETENIPQVRKTKSSS